MRKKIILISVTAVLLAVLAAGVLAGCGDYDYNFQFSVVGENGVIVSPEPEWERGGKTFVTISGGRRASDNNQYKMEFIAAPDKGYKVKEWTHNGKVVEDNQTNSYLAVVSEHTDYYIVITVEFEPISNENKE